MYLIGPLDSAVLRYTLRLEIYGAASAGEQKESL